jgi:hypothetical protein
MLNKSMLMKLIMDGDTRLGLFGDGYELEWIMFANNGANIGVSSDLSEAIDRAGREYENQGLIIKKYDIIVEYTSGDEKSRKVKSVEYRPQAETLLGGGAMFGTD